ncbi:MAG: hypothetical protein F4Y08_06610 [Caldilineaceae bacterium SB0662_bin_9]|uniref:Uncharacterized protein n=1 Tax=Caldilineaceae bacterium SB0662_bin_9 TaxID=2605258 RepID=A0A6B1DRZ7_9CHLR|nr:hypothetical protein [Caldilineaceae bacterium SB0662_bin_9]
MNDKQRDTELQDEDAPHTTPALKADYRGAAPREVAAALLAYRPNPKGENGSSQDECYKCRCRLYACYSCGKRLWCSGCKKCLVCKRRRR